MNCKKIENHFLLFLDNDLPETQQKKVQQHLAACPDCSKRLKQLSNIWQFPEAIEKVEPSGKLWARIDAKLSTLENRPALVFDFWEAITDYAVPIAATVIVFIGVLAGTYLGRRPTDPNSAFSEPEPITAAKADFVKSSHLDAFDDLPPASIGGVYLSLETNK